MYGAREPCELITIFSVRERLRILLKTKLLYSIHTHLTDKLKRSTLLCQENINKLVKQNRICCIGSTNELQPNGVKLYTDDSHCNIAYR